MRPSGETPEQLVPKPHTMPTPQLRSVPARSTAKVSLRRTRSAAIPAARGPAPMRRSSEGRSAPARQNTPTSATGARSTERARPPRTRRRSPRRSARETRRRRCVRNPLPRHAGRPGRVPSRAKQRDVEPWSSRRRPRAARGRLTARGLQLVDGHELRSGGDAARTGSARSPAPVPPGQVWSGADGAVAEGGRAPATTSGRDLRRRFATTPSFGPRRASARCGSRADASASRTRGSSCPAPNGHRNHGLRVDAFACSAMGAGAPSVTSAARPPSPGAAAYGHGSVSGGRRGGRLRRSAGQAPGRLRPTGPARRRVARVPSSAKRVEDALGGVRRAPGAIRVLGVERQRDPERLTHGSSPLRRGRTRRTTPSASSTRFATTARAPPSSCRAGGLARQAGLRVRAR